MADQRRGDASAALRAELREAMGTWGCPLCRLSARAENAFIASLSYERVLDLNTRDALKASRGLCARHSRVWQRLQGSALGIAIVYQASIADLLRSIDPEQAPMPSWFGRRSTPAAMASRLAASGPCPACEAGESAVSRYGEVLLDELPEGDVVPLLSACGGLCLPHLRDVLAMPQSASAYGPLLRAQSDAWQRLTSELAEFIRKNDYRFADEPMSEAEGTSWSRAIDTLVGLEGGEPAG